jgi:hypothetical protein
MISRDNTVDMHDALAHIRDTRPVTRGPIGAYSQLVVAGVTGILTSAGKQIRHARTLSDAHRPSKSASKGP